MLRSRKRWLLGAVAPLILVAGAGTAGTIPAGAQALTPDAGAVPVISTFAGTGQAGFSGDGGPATSAKLNLPNGVSEDIAGNLYIGDPINMRVRRVSVAGIITTVAGNGIPGFGGDGGPATSAKLLLPSGTAVDSSGNLYIADTGNNRIRKVSTAGIISTFAGTGSCGPAGTGGPALTVSLCRPIGVAVDSGQNVYIADSDHHLIRKVTPAGDLSNLAGTGSAGSTGDGGAATAARLSGPTGVATDATHDVFIADTGNNKLRKVNAAGIVTTFAGTGAAGFGGDGGPAALARLSRPTGVGVDPLGNVLIADTYNSRIRQVDQSGVISTLAGTGIPGYSGDGGPAAQARVFLPSGDLAVDASNVNFTDTYNHRGRRIHRGPPPNIPEVPYAILLPLSGLALIGGTIVYRRRRDRRGTTTA